MPAHRTSPDAKRLKDRIHKKKTTTTPMPHEAIGDVPDYLQPLAKEIWGELVDDNPSGVSLTRADRHFVEIASVLMAQQRSGAIKGVDRNHLITILKALGRSPNDRIRLGISDQSESLGETEFSKFIN